MTLLPLPRLGRLEPTKGVLMKPAVLGAARTGPLVPVEWSMEFLQQGTQFIAIVIREGRDMCRLSITADGLDEASAHPVLADRANRWIRDYLRACTN